MLRKSAFKVQSQKRQMSDQSKYEVNPSKAQLGNSLNTEPNGLNKAVNNTTDGVSKVVHNTKSTKVHFMAQNPFIEAQPKLLWRGALTQSPTDRKRYLVFRNIEYIISNWTGDGFPSIIYIRAPGISGYVNDKMIATDRVAALQLSQISPILDDADVRTYDLKYILRDCVTWEIRLTATQLDLNVSIDASEINLDLPLPNPMTINLQLRSQ